MTDRLHPEIANRLRRTPVRLNRRDFLSAMGVILAATACGGGEDGQTTADDSPDPPLVGSDPFVLGVASGDPTAGEVILWTRLTGELGDDEVPVIWEVAEDEDFSRIVASGWQMASAALAHSVHIDAGGLAPDSSYFYRFRIKGQWTSVTGLTRTLPAAESSPDRLRVALASCQDYSDGYYTAHRHLAEEDVAFVLFVGDYIYEDDDDDGPRVAGLADSFTLEQYRERYEVYRSDENLQEVHRRLPWVMTWDDHEVRGNYAGTVDERDDGEDVLARRMAAYQAYYEHTPVRVAFALEDPANTRIYRSFSYGDLAEFWVLDGRQYRTEQPCDGEQGPPCDEIDDPEATMLGEAQKTWLKEGMANSTAHWRVLGQQTVFVLAEIEDFLMNPDQWDGYRAERRELHEFWVENDVDNLVILTGDLHAAGFATVHADPADTSTPAIGHEIVSTSLSSTSSDQVPARAITMALDTVHYFNLEKRGYSVCEFTRDQLRVEYKVVSTIFELEADLEVDAVFTIDYETNQFSS